MQTMIRARCAWLGPDLAPVSPATILISEGTIVATGAEAEEAPVDRTERLDLPDVTLVPGFIDTHVHIGFARPRDVLEGGVTTVRDLAWPPEKIHPLARRSKDADFEGPEIFAAGPMLTAPGGYPTRAAWAPPGTGLEIRNPQEARAAVDLVAAEGAIVVKVALNPPVGPTLDLETLRAVVERAHDRELEVTGHVHGLDELEKALEAGVDELAHMLMSTEAIPEHVLDRMVASGMIVVPTLSVRSSRDLDVAVENLRAFLERGGQVVYGTDLGNEGPKPGIDLREVTAMGAAGMDPRAIAASATSEAARHLGLTDRGTLEPGRRADLIGLTGSIEEAKDLCSVRFVMRGGRRVV